VTVRLTKTVASATLGHKLKKKMSPLLLLALCLLSACLGRAPAAAATTSTNCAKEFERCVTNRDCCGRDGDGDEVLECVTGDWEITTDSTCLSKRSQELETLFKDHGFDHLTITLLLKDFFYQHPLIRDAHLTKKKAHATYEKIAAKYRYDLPRLVTILEQKYQITDKTALPAVINEFVKWKDTVDIADVYARSVAESKSEAEL